MRCVYSMCHGVDQDHALLALQEGQVLRGRVQQGPLERAQERVRGADEEMKQCSSLAQADRAIGVSSGTWTMDGTLDVYGIMGWIYGTIMDGAKIFV